MLAPTNSTFYNFSLNCNIKREKTYKTLEFMEKYDIVDSKLLGGLRWGKCILHLKV